MFPQQTCRNKISIHALREEGDGCGAYGAQVCSQISIHALREEGDCTKKSYGAGAKISIHALREEGDYRLC